MADSSRGQEEKTQEYVDRTYRDFRPRGNLVAFSTAWKETDLYIKADSNLYEEAREAILRVREQIENYIHKHPDFRTSLTPLPLDPRAPAMVQDMLRAAQVASVGPMAAVAGAVSEYVGKELALLSKEVIVENGGDIYLSTRHPTTVSIFAGPSPLSMRLGLKISPEETPCGVCTSSGTVGPSLSLGRADAVTVLASSTCLADAVATALANRIAVAEDLEPTLEQCKTIPDVQGAVAILGDRIGLWGHVNIVKLINKKRNES